MTIRRNFEKYRATISPLWAYGAPAAKKAEAKISQEEIESQIEAFLAAGKKIEKIPMGKTGYVPIPRRRK